MTLHPAARFDWERLVRRCCLPSTTKLVAYAMATYADADGSRVFPGATRLAAVTGLSERSVRGALGNLRDLGLIERTTKGGMRGTRAFADVHQLTIPDDLLERMDLLTVDEEAAPNRQPVPAAADPQPAAPACWGSPSRQLTTSQPAAPSSQPAADDTPTGRSCTPPTHYQPLTEPKTRTPVVPLGAEPPTAREGTRCEKYGHEFSGWPCLACASEAKEARHAS